MTVSVFAKTMLVAFYTIATALMLYTWYSVHCFLHTDYNYRDVIFFIYYAIMVCYTLYRSFKFVNKHIKPLDQEDHE